MTTDNRRANTKKAIQNAMVTLLKTKSFDDITTTKLAKEAGISRSSFYTHYKDKFELIDSISANGTREFQTFIVNKVRLFINTDFQRRFKREKLTPVEAEYSSIYLASAFFGLCQAWIANGKKESPRQMTNLVLKLLPM